MNEDGACCAPGRGGYGPVVDPPGSAVASADARELDMVRVEPGTFHMGCDSGIGYPDDGEAPVHEVALNAFEVSRHTVSNDRFRAFVEDTGFTTDAERFGWSFVFGGLLPDDFEDTAGVAAAPWWRQVFGSDWCHPEGPQSDIGDRGDHPVIHVSHGDARAYCRWAGVRLPTEAEWEYAARGGLSKMIYPWGDEREPGGEHRMNVWQGAFPSDNTGDDGFVGTAPVDAFEPNGYGLFNMCGNVWEWCEDRFDPTYYARSPGMAPMGPDGAEMSAQGELPEQGDLRVMRGGSYLCHESYCRRYRVAARSGNSSDSSTGNIGFRTARDADMTTIG